MTVLKHLERRAIKYAQYVEPRRLRHALVRRRVFALRQPVASDGLPYRVEELFDLRCIFFHIPKTGGLAVSEALFGNHAAGHIDVETARLIFGARGFPTYFKFAFVRNPWDRLVSAYHYLRKGHPTSRVPGIIRKVEDFPTFVKHALRTPEVAKDVHIRAQSSFVVDRDGRSVLDFVGRFERLGADFSVVATKLGVSRSLPVRNQSGHRDYRTYYDAESRELVADFYRSDVEMFEYRFEE